MREENLRQPSVGFQPLAITLGFDEPYLRCCGPGRGLSWSACPSSPARARLTDAAHTHYNIFQIINPHTHKFIPTFTHTKRKIESDIYSQIGHVTDMFGVSLGRKETVFRIALKTYQNLK